MTTPLRLALVICSAGAVIGAPTDSWPVGRARHHVVDDPAAQVMLILNGAKAILPFGGRQGAAYFNDLRAFDGAWRPILQR
jgi:hypothetical protein